MRDQWGRRSSGPSASMPGSSDCVLVMISRGIARDHVTCGFAGWRGICKLLAS